MDSLEHTGASLDERRWDAVLSRQRAADGTFVYAVSSTGIYCRPSCPSRRPKREHVLFYNTPSDAEAARFRPCRRCEPQRAREDSTLERSVIAVRDRLHADPHPLDGAALERLTGYSASHFAKIFKRAIGVTPKQYALQLRRDRLTHTLATASTVHGGAHAAQTPPRVLFEHYDELLGMRPRAARSAGADETIRYTSVPCSLGVCTLGITERGICFIACGDRGEALETELFSRFHRATFVPSGERDTEIIRTVVQLVDGGSGEAPLLDVHGTAFQRRVWEALRKIPWGETISYTELAHRIGAPKGARAVASACAANNIAVLIPCHRVVASSGDLSGYRWGKERKKALLDRERREPQGEGKAVPSGTAVQDYFGEPVRPRGRTR
jgi:AraC family transcriptional regulator, regulatory protein of adaptative response / methylated-DNA-[protein]-cysteine methyltransferase